MWNARLMDWYAVCTGIGEMAMVYVHTYENKDASHR